MASAQQVFPLYNGEIPNSKNCENKEIAEDAGRKVVRNVSLPTLTVFLPERQNPSKLAVIICPGGGYSNLSIHDGGYKVGKNSPKVELYPLF
jgi:hypothetical protein